MTCDSYRILMTGYLDGELSENEILILKTHLQTCEECGAHLKRAEKLKTTFKHYTLFQNTPEVSAGFAENISNRLEEIVRAEQPSLTEKISSNYRIFVLHLAGKWAISLKARPFAWATLVSCLFMFMTGILFLNIFQFASLQDPLQLGGIASKVSIRLTQDTSSSQERIPQTSEPAKISRIPVPPQNAEDNEQLITVAPELITGIVADNVLSEDEAKSPDSIGVSGDPFLNDSEVVQFAEEPFIQVVRTDTGAVGNYVYSHIIEMYQDHFVDDAVFVGYVQNAFID